MKISYNWLKTILPLNLPSKQVADLLTDIGLEVEKSSHYSSVEGGLDGLVIGVIESVKQHPNADRLKITKVNTGEEDSYPIICGAPNVQSGQKVVVALPGTKIYPNGGDAFKIKKAKIRGEVSMGMICAEDEIGLGTNHEGILVLKEDAKVGSKAKDYFNIESDTIFEIGLTPNRADAMGHFGVARDLLVVLKFKGLVPATTSLENNSHSFKKHIKSSFELEVKNNIGCPRYSGQIVSGVQVKESPKWLKERLKSIGLNPKNNIVDITNFILHDLGHPLHAFDVSKIKGNKIVVKNAEKNSSFKTLDGEERKLNEHDLMICNSEEPMCIAGVFGGENSGVTDKTTSVFIESAYFNPHTIRKTAKRHGLNTDASFRFERGVDPNMTLTALQKAVSLILDIAGGEIASEIFDHFPNPIEDKLIDISFSKINSLCGTELTAQQMLEILSYLEIKILKSDSDSASLQVPPFRVDIEREVDIAEEILRIYGFNSNPEPSKINASINLKSSNNSHALKNKISNSLVDTGLTEILSNSLTSREYVKSNSFPHLYDNQHVVLLNPLSKDTEVMRQSLIFNALEVIGYNYKNGEPNVRIFEFGKVYKSIEDSFKEEENLVIALSGLQNKEHWFNSKSEVSFFQLKGIINKLFGSFNLTETMHFIELNNTIYDYGMGVTIGKDYIGEIGAISPILKNQIGIKSDVFLANLNWTLMQKYISNENIQFSTINRFPKVYRDLSVLVDLEISFEKLKNVALNTNKKLLKDVHLFDIYMGKGTPEGKKSYGLRFELLHDEKTLTEKEIDKAMLLIQEAYFKQLNATLR